MTSGEPIDQHEIAIFELINPAIETVGFMDGFVDIVRGEGNEFLWRPFASNFIKPANADNDKLRATTDAAFIGHVSTLSEKTSLRQIGRAA